MSALIKNNRLKLLQVSPLDEMPAARCHSEPASPGVERWRPSRFNARTVTADGGLVVWNTQSGSINYFEAAQSPQVAALLRQQGCGGPLSTLGAYLRDRGFLVRADADEFKALLLAFGEQQYRSDVLELILLASEDCNFRCDYCYETFSRGTMLPAVRRGIKRLVERRASQLRRLNIGWFGGEPLYGFEAIEDLAPFMAAFASEHGISYSSHITTNGYLLDEERIQKLLAWKINQFQITIDGPAEQHDARRPARDGSTTFDTIFANIVSLKAQQADFRTTVRVNYDRESLESIEALLATLEDTLCGDPRFVVAFHAIGKWGGPNDATLPVCGTNDARHAARRFRKVAEDHGLQMDSIRGASGVGSQVCYAARPYNYVIGAAGTLMKCTITLDHQPENVIGRICEDGELEIDRQKLALWVEPAFLDDAGCRSCYLLPSCQGMHCPLVRMEEHRAPCPATKSDLRGELEATLGPPRRSRVPEQARDA